MSALSSGSHMSHGSKRGHEEASRADSPLFMSDRSARSDDEDSEDEDEDEQLYNESVEKFSQRPAFEIGLTTAKKRASTAVQRLYDLLHPYENQSPKLQNILAKTRSALREPDPQRLVVAMVGSTGAGESALLNSITDVSRLAKEVCAGESCTIVPTVYTHRLSWQIDEPFTAEILYYPVSRCRELLHEQLRAYRLFHFQKDGVWNADQEKKYARAADTALETFRTLFCDHEQFESPRSAKGSLQSDFLESRNGLLETMVGWFQEHFHGYSTENDASYQQFADNSADGLNRLVDPLTTPNHRMDEPSLWPLVEKVIVGVPSSRVLEYIDIVDLPGITDTNQIRVNTAHDSIRKCHALWYVIAVDRPCTDPVLDKTLSMYAERFPGALAIIVTHSDHQVFDGEGIAADMREKGQSVGDYAEPTRRKTALMGQLAQVNARLRRKVSSERKLQYHDEKSEVEAQIEEVGNGAFEAIVDVRNNHVASTLKKEKQKYIPAGCSLSVYCVSNTEYATHQRPHARRQLSVDSTGIPELRSFALGLAAPAV